MVTSILRRACAVLSLLAAPTYALAQITVPAGSSFDVPAGSAVNMACTDLNVLGSFALGSGQVAGAGGVEISAGGSVNGGSGSMLVSGDWSNAGTFIPGSSTVTFNDACTSGPITIAGTSVFNNLTLTSTGGGIFVLPEGSLLTVNGTLTLLGAPGQPIQLVSSGSGTAVVNLGPGAQVVQSNATIAGNVRIRAAVANIPTLGVWSTIALAMLMGLVALWRRRHIRN